MALNMKIMLLSIILFIMVLLLMIFQFKALDNYIRMQEDQSETVIEALSKIQLNDTDEMRKDIMNTVKNLSNKNQALLKEKTRSSRISFLFIVMFIVLSSAGLVYLLYDTLKKLSGIKKLAQKLKEGDFSISDQHYENDDVGKIKTILFQLEKELYTKTEIVERIAFGDLTQNVFLSSEKDALGKALALILQQTSSTVFDLRSNAEQVSSGASQISDSSQLLAQGASDQAASIQQISANMLQFGKQSSANAQSASEANKISAEARNSAENGFQQMKRTLAAMDAINDSSNAIGRIIKTIDDIAFQTNLLALNAAVEAARAGKHGKGFAVVAQEVRNLAARSANSAQETSELIESSIKRVDDGNRNVQKTGEVLDEIVQGVSKVADLVGEIAASSIDQAQNIAQMNQGIEQIENITQRNTSMAEETASAGEELSSQALQVHNILSSYKLKKDISSITTLDTAFPAHESEISVPDTSAPKDINEEEIVDNIEASSKPDFVIKLDDDEFGKF